MEEDELTGAQLEQLKLYHLNIQFISEADNSSYHCSKARYMERNTESITGLCPA